MKQQIYRKGIPAGTSYQVADKVGFLDGYLNDSAVVYTNKGPVLISIFSNNLSWGAISDMTKDIVENCS